MATLVTGAAGFIGSHVAEALLARGETVLGLDCFDDYYDPAIKRRNIGAALAHPGFALAEADIRDASALEEALRAHAPRRVIHLAARAGVRPSIEKPLLYEDVNVRGTLTLLEACRKLGIREIVFASSSSVYGATSRVPFHEDDPAVRPVSPYAATKRAGELLAHTYHHLHGLEITCLRFFTVYGPRQRPEMAIHKFVRAVEEGRPLPFYGDGSSRRDYTYIDDAVHGVVRAWESPRGFAIYNIGESRTITLGELVAAIERATGKTARLDRASDQPGDVPATWADIRRARAELGYDPRTPIEEGLQRFVEWFRREQAPERGSGKP